jgi:shikimate dehydrogenase
MSAGNIDAVPAVVDGETRLFVIVGDPIAQVRSPQTFNPRLRDAGRNAVLVPLHIPQARFDTVFPALMALGNLDGIVVTVPFKARALAFADRVLATGERVGAINALRREPDGTWTGDMFDGRGLIRGLRERGHQIAGRRVLLLGAGGAGSATGYALAEAGAAAITIHEVDAAKAERLAAGIRAAHPACHAVAGPPDSAAHDMLINATPIGMADAPRMPVAFGRFDPALLVCDVIVKPEETPLLRHAMECGCTAVGGRAMHEGQLDELLRFFRIEMPEGE